MGQAVIEMEIERTLEFHAAHQLPACCETPECERLHGHTYKLHAVWMLRAGSGAQFLTDEGMVCNFARLKRLLAGVERLFDHEFLNAVKLPVVDGLGTWSFAGTQELYSGLPHGAEVVDEIRSSTAENLAIWVFHYLQQLGRSADPELTLPAGFELREVRLWETARNCVTFRLVS